MLIKKIKGRINWYGLNRIQVNTGIVRWEILIRKFFFQHKNNYFKKTLVSISILFRVQNTNRSKFF